MWRDTEEYVWRETILMLGVVFSATSMGDIMYIARGKATDDYF